jgi:hypothetical protein
MRTFMKVLIPVEAGNSTIKDGMLPATVMGFVEKFKPEAVYFISEDGQRAGIFVFDIEDASEIPAMAEPFFMNLNAKVFVTPAMNLEDLQKGLSKL